ncbi:MAG: peptidoglycan -binding protein [Alphaproteobacteria bacterium]|nr:peptidoglycan -binding protein [Alphaproteobacteria bacterium]MBU0798047.1 peptidoglycan -binding protein [Alphaproteobacteria bacterium]MBU0888747.1 peptidoglycan -binding protein [Alphaproteobacteria bacterium]MBU1812534.1 peptidoglycan -binding protein [Alphaproteobacteria bacterium]MBU2091146.1 peptidoglycan -binding protein [Alphaproteobacteria bacterium]
MSTARRQRRHLDIWPGFVDALGALLAVILFLLMVFIVAQFYLTQTLSGREQALLRLERQIVELTDLLSLERETNADLRLNIAQISAELQGSIATRDELTVRISQVENQRETLQSRLATALADLESAESKLDGAEASRDRASAELADAYTVIQADRATIEAQLRDLERLNRDIATLRQLREELESRVTQLAAVASTAEQAQMDAAEKEKRIEALLAELTAARDRSKELEARLSTTEERTALAQKDIETKDVQISRLRGALENEEKLSAQQQDQIALLNQQLLALRQQLARISEALDVSEAKSKEQDAQIVDLGRRLNLALASKVEELARYRSEFFGRLRALLEDRKNVRIVGDRFIFQSEVFFDSGAAALAQGGQEQLNQLAALLQEIGRQIPPDIDWVLQVEGHTDNVPIATAQFPSNWELSAARAISVVRQLMAAGVPANRLAAAGYADNRPITSNQTEAGRQQNRRIELKLTAR